MKQTLTENLTGSQANLILESGDVDKNGTKPFYMQGIFVQGGVTNHNGRVYPVSEIAKAVSRVNEIINRGDSILGECDHPSALNINLDRVSHFIVKMWMDGPNGMGKLKIVPTPTGNIIRVLLEEGVKLGVSSRGTGEVDRRGYVSDFEFETVDIVAKPSAPSAYPKVVHEAFNAKNGKLIHELATDFNYDDRAKVYLKDELRSWINSLNKK